MAETNTIGIWSCNSCSTVKGVSNGYCPKCGPTQTTPQDDDAKALAGVNQPEVKKATDEKSDAVK